MKMISITMLALASLGAQASEPNPCQAIEQPAAEAAPGPAARAGRAALLSVLGGDSRKGSAVIAAAGGATSAAPSTTTDPKAQSAHVQAVADCYRERDQDRAEQEAAKPKESEGVHLWD